MLRHDKSQKDKKGKAGLNEPILKARQGKTRPASIRRGRVRTETVRQGKTITTPRDKAVHDDEQKLDKLRGNE